MLIECECDAFLQESAMFDLLIDARSPKEYHESHILGAENLYALSDAQHQEVGTMYKQVSHNDAKLLGARYICENAARHLKTIGERFKIGAKIGIYCAKGGLRSSSIAIILSHVGYQVYRLKGGYKRYRYHVLSFFEHLPHERFIVLGGYTGCGKTELLHQLSPSLDIEGAAKHLGSSFGAIAGEQPSQKMFENTLFTRLSAIDPNEFIFVEAESKRLGRVTVPSLLHQRLLKGYRVEINAPMPQRIERIQKVYRSVTAAFFYQAMEAISAYIKRSIKERILEAYEKDDLQTVVSLLLTDYYDLVYKKCLQPNIRLEYDTFEETLAMLRILHVKLTQSV